MLQTITAPLTLEEFFEHVPDHGRHELRNGVVVKMQPTGTHKQVAGFLGQAARLIALGDPDQEGGNC